MTLVRNQILFCSSELGAGPIAQTKIPDVAEIKFVWTPDMQKLTFRKGQTIYRIGDRLTSVYFLVSGQVGLFAPTDLSNPYLHIDEHEVFGENSLFEEQLRSAKAVCLNDCEVLEIAKSDIMPMLENTDPLIKVLVKTLIARQNDTEKKLACQRRPVAA